MLAPPATSGGGGSSYLRQLPTRRDKPLLPAESNLSTASTSTSTSMSSSSSSPPPPPPPPLPLPLQLRSASLELKLSKFHFYKRKQQDPRQQQQQKPQASIEARAKQSIAIISDNEDIRQQYRQTRGGESKISSLELEQRLASCVSSSATRRDIIDCNEQQPLQPMLTATQQVGAATRGATIARVDIATRRQPDSRAGEQDNDPKAATRTLSSSRRRPEAVAKGRVWRREVHIPDDSVRDNGESGGSSSSGGGKDTSWLESSSESESLASQASGKGSSLRCLHCRRQWLDVESAATCCSSGAVVIEDDDEIRSSGKNFVIGNPITGNHSSRNSIGRGESLAGATQGGCELWRHHRDQDQRTTQRQVIEKSGSRHFGHKSPSRNFEDITSSHSTNLSSTSPIYRRSTSESQLKLIKRETFSIEQQIRRLLDLNCSNKEPEGVEENQLSSEKRDQTVIDKWREWSKQQVVLESSETKAIKNSVEFGSTKENCTYASSGDIMKSSSQGYQQQQQRKQQFGGYDGPSGGSGRLGSGGGRDCNHSGGYKDLNYHHQSSKSKTNYQSHMNMSYGQAPGGVGGNQCPYGQPASKKQAIGSSGGNSKYNSSNSSLSTNQPDRLMLFMLASRRPTINPEVERDARILKWMHNCRNSSG